MDKTPIGELLSGCCEMRASRSSYFEVRRNKPPLSGQENDQINDHISDLEQSTLSYPHDNPGMANSELIVKIGKCRCTIIRIGSNKTRYQNVR